MPDNFREPTRTMGPRSPGSDHSHPLSLVVKNGDESNALVHKKKVVENKLGSSRMPHSSSMEAFHSNTGSDTTSGFSSDASNGENQASPASICIASKSELRGVDQPQDFSVERFIKDSTSTERGKNLQPDEDGSVPIPLVVRKKNVNHCTLESNDDGSNISDSKPSSGYNSPTEDSGHDGEVEDNLDTSGGSSPIVQPGRYMLCPPKSLENIGSNEFVASIDSPPLQSKAKEMVIPEISLERKVNHLISSHSTSFNVHESKRDSIQPNVTIEKIITKDKSSDESENTNEDTNDKEIRNHKNDSNRKSEFRLALKVKEFAKFNTDVVDAGEMERQLLCHNKKYEQTLAALTGNGKKSMPMQRNEKLLKDENLRTKIVEQHEPTGGRIAKSSADGRQRDEEMDIISEVSSIDTWMSGASYNSYMRSGLQTPHLDDTLKNHSSNPSNYSCTFCDKSFTNTYHLNSHLVIHTGEKSFACPQCDKSFGRRSTLRAHMTTHSKTSNFMCPVCEKACNDNNSLEEHIRYALNIYLKFLHICTQILKMNKLKP